MRCLLKSIVFPCASAPPSGGTGAGFVLLVRYYGAEGTRGPSGRTLTSDRDVAVLFRGQWFALLPLESSSDLDEERGGSELIARCRAMR